MFIARELIVHAECGAVQARLAQIASASGLVSASQAAYQDGLTHLARVGPLVPHRASPSWSPSRSLTRQWRIQALVTGHGSPQVQRLLGAWAETAGKVENADQVMGLADRARGPAPGLEQEARQERRALEDRRKARCAAAGGCLCPDERGADRAGSAGPAVSRYLPTVRHRCAGHGSTPRCGGG
jgi:hypothetical protein